MIEILQSNSANAVQAMEVSRQQASSVVERAQNADSALHAISASVAQIDQMSSQIATAAEQQSSVTDEMSRNIDHINNIDDYRSQLRPGDKAPGMARPFQALQRCILA